MTNNAARPIVLLIAFVIILCIAVGWKAARYMTPPVRMDATFDQRLTGFLDARDWSRQEPSPNTENKAVQIITFTKTQCPNPLRISIVGTTSGLESYLRQKFGDDIAFVQHGSVRKHPSLLWYQVMSAWRSAKAVMSGNPRVERDPILAVIPAPKEISTTCGAPPASSWPRL